MKTILEADTDKKLTQLGFSLTVHSMSADVKEDWPNVKFQVELFFNSRRVLETSFQMGVGCVDFQKARKEHFDLRRGGFITDEISVLNTLASKPHANLLDKKLWADTAYKCAVMQKVKPSLSEVLNALLSDGEAFFQSMSFEDWCANFGYETDSRKAEHIYRQCDDTGRALSARITPEGLQEARTILQDF